MMLIIGRSLENSSNILLTSKDASIEAFSHSSQGGVLDQPKSALISKRVPLLSGQSAKAVLQWHWILLMEEILHKLIW